jgi:hypothetical protein
MFTFHWLTGFMIIVINNKFLHINMKVFLIIHSLLQGLELFIGLFNDDAVLYGCETDLLF